MALPFKKPMLCGDAEDVADALRGREGWIEPKLDGWRGLVEIDADGIAHLWGRSGAELTYFLPEVCMALGILDVTDPGWKAIDMTELDLEECAKPGLPPDTILDGEFRSTNDEWGTVQSVMGGHPKRWARERTPIQYAMFDLVRFDGYAAGQLPYRERRPMLERVFALLDSDRVRLVPRYPATQEVYETMVASGFEGGVVKIGDGRYVPGSRNGGFIRLKYSTTIDVVAMKIEEGGGKRLGEVGAIEFGQYRDGELVSRGACGTGFGYGDGASGAWIWENRDSLIGQPFEVTVWIGIGETPRTPSFSRWRIGDKAAEDCVWQEIRPTMNGASA